MPVCETDAVGVEVLGEAQRLLVGEGRQRRRAVVGVDHQQVARVGPDVQDAEAHGSTLPGVPDAGVAPPRPP